MWWDFVVPGIQNVLLFHHHCTISEHFYMTQHQQIVLYEKYISNLMLSLLAQEQDIPII